MMLNWKATENCCGENAMSQISNVGGLHAEH